MAANKEVDLTAASTSTNVLHYFRSFNYLFTLSAVPQADFKKAVNEEQVAALAEKFVIAKSAGKGSTGFDVNAVSPIQRNLVDEARVQFDDDGNRMPPAIVDDYSGRDLVKKFNKESSGRFDFFFENFEIETIMAFDKRTGFSKGSKISFDIIEPYSLAGLIEALQVGAVASGHPSYKSAPFILKLEFIGYPDWNDITNESPIKVDKATRYFIIKFSEVNIQADEKGTKYSCKAVPLNELAFGEPNKLKTSMSAQGETVGEFLTNFQEQLNNSAKEVNQLSYSKETGNKLQADEYQILFPAIDLATGEIKFDSTSDVISKKKIGELSVDNVPWAFIDPVTHADKTEELRAKGIKRFTYSPTKISVQFSSGANIHDIISAIVRDSEYGTEIFKNFDNRLDANDHIDYFNIVTEAIPKALWNGATSQPYYIYKFYVVPYKMHFTRIPGFENSTIDPSKVNRLIRRTYDYLYTGKNTDVMNFNLTFNNLYFQNQPLREGNQAFDSSTGGLARPTNDALITVNVSDVDAAKGTGSSVNERRVDTRSLEVGYGGEGTRELQDDPYRVMVKNLHQAIIDNVGMATLDIEILGDPIYLVQNGLGNLRVNLNPSAAGLTMTGDLDFQASDIYVLVNFRNPTDINPKTGMMDFNEVTSFSGIYRVNTVTSKFNNGLFTQRLSMIRMPGQPTDTKQQTPEKAITITWYDDQEF